MGLIVAADDGLAGLGMMLFNPFGVGIIYGSSLPGFAPRAGLFRPFGVASGVPLLRLWHDHAAWSIGRENARRGRDLEDRGGDRAGDPARVG